MAELTFSETGDKIPIDEYFRIINWLDKTLAVGVELERPCAASHQILAEKFKTTIGKVNNLSVFKQSPCNEYNIAYLYSDGSVHNSEGRAGVEIVFAGSIEKFGFIRERLAKIEKLLDNHGCEDYHNSCSNHITLISLQDRLISPLVLKNILQISRAFSSGLYWLGSAERIRISRASAGRYAEPQITFTPLEKTLNELVNTGKFRMCNMSKQPIFRTGRGDNDVMMSGIFVEFRNPDGMRVPSAIAALMMMYKAIVYKAVELSTKGVINVDSFEHWAANKRVTMALLAGEVSAASRDFPMENAKELLRFIGPQLKTVSSEASEIISDMADNNIGLRYRKDDATYKTIEKELSGRKSDECLSDKEQKMVEIVMNERIKAATPSLYREEMAGQLDVSVRMVEYLMQKVREKTGKGMVYDSESKCYRIE